MRMLENDGAPDALFFYQLLLPLHDTKKTIQGDPRQLYYSEKSKWTNVYAAELGLMGSGYGHKFEPVNPTQLLKWDGIIVQDGVHGGSNGAILRRTDLREGNTAYDKHIVDAFTKSRWLEIKRCIKNCVRMTKQDIKKVTFSTILLTNMTTSTTQSSIMSTSWHFFVVWIYAVMSWRSELMGGVKPAPVFYH